MPSIASVDERPQRGVGVDRRLLEPRLGERRRAERHDRDAIGMLAFRVQELLRRGRGAGRAARRASTSTGRSRARSPCSRRGSGRSSPLTRFPFSKTVGGFADRAPTGRRAGRRDSRRSSTWRRSYARPGRSCCLTCHQQRESRREDGGHAPPRAQLQCLFERVRRQLDAVRRELVEEVRPQPGRAERPEQGRLGCATRLSSSVDRVTNRSWSVTTSPSRPNTSVIAAHAPAAVDQADQVDDQVERGGDLLADGPQRQVDAAHEHEHLEAVERVARRVRVDRRQRSLVARVHRLEHVERLGAADLADDDAVGAHAQGVADELADPDLALALDVRRPRLERDDVALLELELGRVLDRHDALVARDEARERVQERRLARARFRRRSGC